MSHSRAWDCEKAIRTHPKLETQLIILSVPNLQSLVVASELIEEKFSIDGERTSQHDWIGKRLDVVFPVLGEFWKLVKVEVPVNGASRA
jgi:hypothetical protein